MTNLKTLTLKDIREAMANNGYDAADFTHASFANVVTRYGLSFRYVVVYRDSNEADGVGQGSVYVYVSEDGLIKADF